MISNAKASICCMALLVPTALACSSASPARIVPAEGETLQSADSALIAPVRQAYDKVQLVTWPGAQCNLHPKGDLSLDETVAVYPDDLGIAQFGAVHATSTDTVTVLSLDCKDDSGRSQTYDIDLTATSSFAPLPDSVRAPTNVPLRPALTGDPMARSRQELLHAGYGLRPDPTESPNEYALWLQNASIPARMVHAKNLPTRGHGGSGSGISNQVWGGGMFTTPSKAGGKYVTTWYNYVVPSPTHGSGCSAAYMWGGTGGFNDVGLIQDGVQYLGTSSAVSMFMTKEYWSGNGVGGNCYQNECSVGINVSPGDHIYGVAWSCDSSGNATETGGFGCYFMEDVTPSPAVVVSCETPTSSCPSLRQINAYQGPTAEAILENNGPNNWCGSTGTFTNVGSISMQVSVEDNKPAIQDFGNTAATNITLVNASGQSLATTTLDNPAPYGEKIVWQRAN